MVQQNTQPPKKKPRFYSVAFKFTNTEQVENLTHPMILFTTH